jgi:BirA family biotin operon repressor/biotin-[acetyl-CoA-carboxylase] ligase
VSLPVDLDPARLEAAVPTRRFGRPLIVLASCPSTNDAVAARARQGTGDEGLVLVADAQSGGRGRLGRSWHSPPGENLYFSLLLRPAISPALIPPLTLLVGAAVAEVLAAAGARPRLKWPNDVLLPTSAGLRKVAGILTEMASERDRIRQVVIGIGLNVHTSSFPPELADRATSLALATGGAFDRGTLLVQLLGALETAYDRFLAAGPAETIARWRQHADLGRRCRIERDGNVLEGIALDVDADGALVVRDDAGRVHRVMSGEVS